MGKRISVKLFYMLCFVLFWSTYAYASIHIVKDVEIKKSELIVTFNKKFDQKSVRKFTLLHPYRQVFDLKNTRFKDIHLAKKWSDTIRIAQFKPNIVRIVMQGNRGFLCKAYRPLSKNNEFHLPLYTKTKPKTKPKAYRSSKSINAIFSEVEMLNKDERLKYRLDRQAQAEVLTELPILRERSNKKDLIVIDAGHGGHDGGATAGGKCEKDLVLSIAKKVSKFLKKHGYSVYLTRTKDTFLKLSQRTKIADKKGAVAFISIHANSVPKRKRKKVHGIETFFLQTTRDAKSQRIAVRENAAVLKGAGSNLSKKVIVDSVLNGPKIIESNKLAIDVQRRIMSNVRHKYNGVKDGGVRHAPFYVLVGASRPSILVEVGYISHPRERKRLFTPSYQNLIATGIAEGVNTYLNNRKKEIDID